ncbi:MAG TPA: trigger factor [Pyrinomonadaceae bacterium]|nr:trigger factor [Pyrinomonadaceae bacterium]
MKTELIDVSPTRKEIRIEIEPAQIRDTYDRISKQYSKAANVPGFRPGHAPTSVVRTRYKSEIRTEVLRELLPEAVNNAIIEHSLNALGEPDVELDNTAALERLGEEPLTIKVGVEVLPEVQLDTYKGLEVDRRKRPITDADVDRMIDSLRDSSASLQPVEDRASELGDTVTVNARGNFVEEPEEEDIKVDDVEVVLGGQGVQQEFTDNLTGVRAEESRTFTVEYPADFTSPGLAGKKVQYTTEVTSVRKKELPELDDEWAKSLGGDFDSVDTLKTRIREDLEARATAESDHMLRNEIMKKLLDAHQFEVPESLLNQQTAQRYRTLAHQMSQRGIDPNNPEINWESARDELRDQAEADLRATMLLEKIAEVENIAVSDEEVEAEIDAIATASQQPKEQVRAALTKNGGERSIAHRLRTRKALDLLVENARVTDAEWTAPKEAEATAEESPAVDENNVP